MSEEAAPAPVEAPATTPAAAEAPAPTGAPAPSAGAPSAEAAGDAVGEAMEAQGVTDPGDLDWSRAVTVTVDGKERQVPLSELRGNYELRRSSFDRFEEAKRMREGAEKETQRLQEIAGALKDPAMAPHVLRELGYAPEQLQEVMDAIRGELELPDDKRRERELTRREQQLQEREQAYKAQRQREAAARDQAMFVKAFDSALDPHGLSGDKEAMRTMASYLDHRYPRAAGARLTEAEIGKLSAEAASYAAEQRVAQRRQAIQGIDPNELAKLLPPEHLQALREQRVEEYRQGKAAPAAKAKPATREEPERKRVNSLADFRKILEGG